MIYKYNTIKNISKAIDKARVYGILNTYKIEFYDIVNEYFELSKNNINFLDKAIILRDFIRTFQNTNSTILCNTFIKTPSIETQIDNGNTTNNTIPDNSSGGSIPGSNGGNSTVNGSDTSSSSNGNSIDNQDNTITNPNNSVEESFILDSFNVFTEKQQISSTSSTLSDAYTFSLQDILDNYSYGTIYSVSIDRSNLQNGLIKQGNISYSQFNSNLTILAEDLGDYLYTSSSISQYVHPLNIRVSSIDNNGNIRTSNTATITINRTASGVQNLPATIGDIAIKTQNRAITVLSLPMFTSSLTPPYNDPENDLIDAIRIDEISTANKGVFYYNGIPLSEGQILTREEINTGLLTHEGPDLNTIETDAINFSARDEGSLIWVN